MNLNNQNGTFEIGGFIIKPSDKVTDIKNVFINENLELWIENSEWITYRLQVANKFILLLKFFNDYLKTIEIYLRKYPEKQNKHEIQNLLKKLGGESTYIWGNVELNIDIKAGYESIVININDLA